MKLTKSKLRQIIQEEMEEIGAASWPDANEVKAAQLYRGCLKMSGTRTKYPDWDTPSSACLDNLLDFKDVTEEELNKLRPYILNLKARWSNEKGEYEIRKKATYQQNRILRRFLQNRPKKSIRRWPTDHIFKFRRKYMVRQKERLKASRHN